MKLEIISGTKSNTKNKFANPAGINTKVRVDDVDISQDLSYCYFEVNANDGIANWEIGRKGDFRLFFFLRFKLRQLWYKIKRVMS